VKVYAKGASKRRMARKALLTLLKADQSRISDLPTPATVSPTGWQALENKERHEEDGGSDGTRTRDLRRDRPTL
jgi:hypothetical protein